MKGEVTADLVDEALERTRTQEAVYGHNTGHFSLSVEKENTLIGTLGELVAREALREVVFGSAITIEVDLAPIGAPADLIVKVGRGGQQGVHVKTGLWKKWPRPDFSFGVHADQGIEFSSAPLVLVSLVRLERDSAFEFRIEGFVTPEFLKSCKRIGRGERFPNTGVVSRTDNFVTYFSDYQDISKIFPGLY